MLFACVSHATCIQSHNFRMRKFVILHVKIELIRMRFACMSHVKI